MLTDDKSGEQYLTVPEIHEIQRNSIDQYDRLGVVLYQATDAQGDKLVLTDHFEDALVVIPEDAVVFIATTIQGAYLTREQVEQLIESLGALVKYN